MKHLTKRAQKILQENKDKLTELAKLLLEKEVIFKDDLEKIFGKRPFDEAVTSDERSKNKDEEKPKENTLKEVVEQPVTATETKSEENSGNGQLTIDDSNDNSTSTETESEAKLP